MRRFTRSLAVGLLATMFAACGADDGPPVDDAPPHDDGGGGGTGTGPDDESTVGANPFNRDTSDHEGLLYWSTPWGEGVSIWDLKKSKYIWWLKPIEAEFSAVGRPHIAADAPVFAQTYSRTSGFYYVGEVRVYKLGEEAYTAYPNGGLTDDQIRSSSGSSLSADGRYLAAIVNTLTVDGTGEVVGQTPKGVEIWDRELGTRTTVPGADEDQSPMLTEDAASVTFVSYRDGLQGDFYRASRASLNDVTRLSVLGHPDIADLNLARQQPQMSADGRWIVFIGGLMDGGDAAFLFDTTTETVTRISGEYDDVAIVAISADGSTISWARENGQPDHSVSPPGYVGHGVIAKRESPEVPLTTLDDVASDAGPIALSRDGSTAAYITNNLYDLSLIVLRTDGSKRRVVTKADDEGDVNFIGWAVMRFR